MKTTLALAGLALTLCSFAPAQDDTGQRVVVPARNSSRPRKVSAHTLQGGITVKAYNGKEAIVESSDGGPRPPRRPEHIDGMRRIDGIPRGLSVEEEDNQITVRMSPPGHGS